MAEYGWRAGRKRPGDVQAIGELLNRIQIEKGAVIPDYVIDESRDPNSPSHPCFEWDDTKAAEHHRRWQARTLIRSIVVKTEARPTPTPMFIHTSDDDGGPRYMAASVIVSRPDLLQMARRHAASFLRSARVRLTEIEELERSANDAEALLLIEQAEDKLAS